MRKAVVFPIGLLVLLLAGAGVAMAAYDHSRREQIAPGVRIGGVDVGGLKAPAAQARVEQALSARLNRPVVVVAAGHRFRLPASRIHPHVDVAALVDQAVTASRGGSILARTVRSLKDSPVHTRIPIAVDFDRAPVDRLTRRVAAAVNRPPRDAAVHPSAGGLQETSSQTGLQVRRAALERKLMAHLRRARGSRTVRARVTTLEPKVSLAALRKKYPAYIIVDRGAFTLRFYKHLRFQKSYPIAVGMQGLETPAGLYDIQWKQTNPSWYVPNSAWAGALAGKVIPPGPQDPIKARWMAFNGGAGIHGIDPSEYGSIGHDASHGCVRMRIPDVIELYSQTPVGTPVFVA
ncbi:MAG TPA: L,D-transpeptidase/peptidoglycan binding protein [Solirubrobacteraceae bacterium]|jgi:lipoprotein-anchoring transpeptidase ErfK/SrfK